MPVRRPARSVYRELSLALGIVAFTTGCLDSVTRPDGGAELDGGAPDATDDAGKPAPDAAHVPDAGDTADGDEDGGGEDDGCADPDATCGTFVFGDVTGLGYATPTHAGRTDQHGSFRYEPGEEVTFFVGGVTLGSALGAPRVSPFDLVGLTPPTTELEIRTALHDPTDVSDFDRVANIAHLLVALDDDLDPDNGIDLTGWDTKLVDESLRFDAPMYRFAADELERLARRHGVSRNVVITTPLVHLYRALGITVVAHAVTQAREDYDDNGTFDLFIDHTYDVDGRLTDRVWDSDDAGDDEWVERTTYDDEGRRRSHVSAYFDANAWVTDGSVTLGHDARGNVVTSATRADDDYDGELDPAIVRTRTYDARDNWLTEVETSVLGLRRSTSTYDAIGNPLSRVLHDEIYDYTDTLVHVYDAQGRVASSTSVLAAPAGRDRRTTTYTYDALGRVASARETFDSRDDGSIENVFVDMNTYHPTDGYRSTHERTLDFGGPTVRHNTETYDAHGRVLVRFEGRRPVGDVFTETSTGTNTYAANGDLLSVRTELVSNGVTSSFGATFTYVYGASGNLLERLQIRDTATPSGLWRTRHVYQYIERPDGLLYLISAYAPAL